MSKYFYRFMIIVLFAFLGISILGSGQVFASGSSFNVPHVNDHFEKVQPGPAPTKETSVTPTPQKEKEDGDGNWLKKAWNWTKETVSSAWNKTKEVCSEAWDWICNVCDKIAKVIVDGLSAAWDWIKENIVTIGLTIGIIALVIVAVVLIVFGGEFVLGAVVISGASLGQGILAGIVISGLFSWINGKDFLGTEMLSDMLIGGLSGGIGGAASSSIAGSGFVSWLGSKISWLGESFPKIFGEAVGSGIGQTFYDLFKTGKVNLRNTVVATIFGGLLSLTSLSISDYSGSILSKITDLPIPTLEVRVLNASGNEMPSLSFGKITVGDTEFGQWLQKFASNGGGEGASKPTTKIVDGKEYNLFGDNPVPKYKKGKLTRINTDMTGGRQKAESIFQQLEKGNTVVVQKVGNTTLKIINDKDGQRVAQLRLRDDGKTNLDLWINGVYEDIHFKP